MFNVIKPENLTNGETILLFRRRNGETQKQAAERYGTGTTQLYYYENNLLGTSIREKIDYLESNEICFLLRRRKSLTQKYVGDQLGCTAEWVKKMEKGTGNPKDLIQFWKKFLQI